MAEEENTDEETAKPKSYFLTNIIVSSVLAFVFGGLGYLAVAYFGSANAAESTDEPLAGAKPAFVEFGELVVNIQDGRMTRFLRINPTLQVDAETLEETTTDVESQRAILRNWLISYLSDIKLDELRGSAAQNRIRRDISNYFNDVISPDGLEVIEDVLFQEFQLQ